jgi:hypothetical protein
VPITDQFLSALSPISSGPVPKDQDIRFENLVRGAGYVKLKVGYLKAGTK